MALYLGGEKLKINLDGVVYHLNFYSSTPMTNSVILLSSDGYILKDFNSSYLTAKEGD